MTAAATHAELSHLIARGDRRRAASLLVRDHAPAVLSLCRAMVRDPRLAEDLSQDAFARAFGALEGFRGEASPRTWLLKIARNRCLDHLARARRAPWVGAGDPDLDDQAADEPPPYDLLSRREDAERAMAVLGESERALVVLHFGHGVGYPELADSFGLREGAVRMRISRALARMRAALSSELDSAFDDMLGGQMQRSASPERTAGLSEARSAHFPASPSEAAAWDAAFDADDEPVSIGADAALDLEESLESFEAPLDASFEESFEESFDAAFEEPTQASAPALREPLSSGAAPPTFDALREEVSPALRHRLDELAASL